MGDWYENNATHDIEWFDGSADKAGYTRKENSFTDKGIYYAPNGNKYDDSAASGGNPIENGKTGNIQEVVMDSPGLIAQKNLQAARTRLGAAEDAFWGTKPDGISYSPSISFGIPGTNSNFSIRGGIILNLRGGDIGLFGSYGFNYGVTPSGVGVNLLSFGVHNLYGEAKDVISEMSGKSVGYEVNALGQGFEYSTSAADGTLMPASSGVKSYNFNVGPIKPVGGGTVSWSNGWSGKFKYSPEFN